MNSIAVPVRLRLTYDNAEALKWLAFVSMVIDHANTIFADRAWAWAIPIGRLAFPLFAIVIGRHLGDVATSTRLGWRLVVVGLVASWPALVTINGGHVLPLNILWTFALALVVWHLVRLNWCVTAFVVAVCLSPFVDYGPAGVGLVLASAVWWRWGGSAAWLLAAGLAALCWWNGNLWALLAVPVAYAAAVFDWRVPRVRHFFWVAYPGHLVVLALFAWLLWR